AGYRHRAGELVRGTQHDRSTTLNRDRRVKTRLDDGAIYGDCPTARDQEHAVWHRADRQGRRLAARAVGRVGNDQVAAAAVVREHHVGDRVDGRTIQEDGAVVRRGGIADPDIAAGAGG